MRKRINEYIEIWQGRCYPELPDEAPEEISDKVPSYKQICLAILQNDMCLQTLGFSKPKSEIYSSLKRIEINERIRKNSGEIKDNI